MAAWLVDPGLQSQHVYAISGVDCQVVEHQLAESSTAELGPHIHAFDLTIVGADQLDSATPS
jgi:hypothetical protein